MVPVTTQVRTISERVTNKEEPLVAKSIFSLLPAVQGTALPLGKDAVGKTNASDRATEQARGGVFGLVSPFLGHEAKKPASVLTPVDGLLDSVTWVARTPTPTSPSTSATLMLTASASFAESYPKAKLGKMVSDGMRFNSAFSFCLKNIYLWMEMFNPESFSVSQRTIRD